MKAIVSSRRSSFINASSTRNSLAYVLRSRRIAEPKTNTRISSLDTVKRIKKCWTTRGEGVYVHRDYDKLQYILAYSNLDKNPADLYSLSRGKAVTAERLHEESDEYSLLARLYRHKAKTCQYNAIQYNCKKYFKYAAEYEEDAEYYENEAQRHYDWALEMERAAEFFQYEAEELEEEEAYVSGWESWLDID